MAQDAGLYSSNKFAAFVTDVESREQRHWMFDLQAQPRLRDVLKIGGAMAGVPTLVCPLELHNIRA